MDVLKEAGLVLDRELAAITWTRENLGAGFVAAVETLFGCRGKVVVSGLGKSGLIGRKIAATLASTGTPAVFMHPAEGMHGDLGMIVRGDVAVLLSNSGETEEIVRLVPSVRRIDVPIVALTCRPDSTLARHATQVLLVGGDGDTGPDGLVPTSSTTAMLAVGDALAVVLLKMRGFDREDFARLHPGGSLGRKLLLQVDDIMHAGEAVPIVELQAGMKEAIIEMTGKGLGAVCVVDAAGVLAGIVTDGDLRRAIERFPNLLEKNAAEIMTREPVTIRAGTLAAEAVRLMEERPSQISVLPVVDERHRPRGLVRLHDLVKAGVA